MKKIFFLFLIGSSLLADAQRKVLPFNSDWKFLLSNDSSLHQPSPKDPNWRTVRLPHDWSIEMPFDEKAPATTQGGALPGGIGWYTKTFLVPENTKSQKVYIEFDGIYRNSEVWINGHLLGKRPNGYISFSYELTPYLKYRSSLNTILVKADNALQPNSRWYTGSGIYRNVRLVTVPLVHINHRDLFISTPVISKESATVSIVCNIQPMQKANQPLQLIAVVYDEKGKPVQRCATVVKDIKTSWSVQQLANIPRPQLWSVQTPHLYTLELSLHQGDKLIDQIKTRFGIRSFAFDPLKGFALNGQPLKIKGVCLHHDLGALGAAVNKTAIRRQLQLLKDMGCNAIRTAHNPPATELLDLCDEMGFLVMDEAFDMWKKKKNKHDYYADFSDWHRRDLEDQVRRDRNHPSVFMWSIGNEIREQFDSSGISLTNELVKIVKTLDTTRPVTAALSEWNPKKNFMFQSGALDVVGLNYHHEMYPELLKHYPGQKLIAAETMSALASRGDYDMPSDSLMFWPQHSPLKYVEGGNKDFTVSAYDQVAAYWGSTHEQTWKMVKKYDYLSGLFVWTGFDYLGEPTPYPWPARSSYFGIIDLAGFPKDAYYMYQSEWTEKPVLHLFPHWNWEAGKTVDVWAYYNQADEAELFLNGQSLGVKRKENEDLHVMWRVKYMPGTLKIVSRKNGKTVLEKEIKTAGSPAKLLLTSDKKIIHHSGDELAFVTVKILDKDGNLVPRANNRIDFLVEGAGEIAGVDNGNPVNLLPFKASYSKAYNGLCLGIIRSFNKSGTIRLIAKSEGLELGSVSIEVR